MKRFLFIGHEAGRSGAPAALLYLLQWLRENHPEIQTDLILLKGGPLVPEFEKAARVFLSPKTRFSKLASRIARKLKIRPRVNLVGLPKPGDGYDAVLGNTILSLDTLELFARGGAGTILWLHEMDLVIDSFFSRKQFKRLTGSIDSIVAAAGAVQRKLSDRGIPPPIYVAYEPLPPRQIDHEAIGSFRARLGIPPDAFVVGGCGVISWRKGTDLFAAAAERLAARYNDIYFVWPGAKSEPFDRLLAADPTATRERVIFPGEIVDIDTFFADIDLFTLASREDPFPLVCLNAADFAKPIICFEDAGGMPEFVASGAGKIVPYGNLDAFCKAIEDYYFDRESAKRDGETAKRVRSDKFSFEASCSRIFDVLNNT